MDGHYPVPLVTELISELKSDGEFDRIVAAGAAMEPAS